MTVSIKETDTFVEHDIIVDGTIVGNVKLCPTSREIARLVIFEPYQNKGYGSEVVGQLVDKGYNMLFVRSDNLRAIHVYKKFGFVKTGVEMFQMQRESCCGKRSYEHIHYPQVEGITPIK